MPSRPPTPKRKRAQLLRIWLHVGHGQSLAHLMLRRWMCNAGAIAEERVETAASRCNLCRMQAKVRALAPHKSATLALASALLAMRRRYSSVH